MFRTILCDPANMGFQNMIAIQKGHFPIGFNPNFVHRMRRQKLQRCYMKPELATFGRKVGEGRGDVVHTVFVQAEDMGVFRA